MSDLRLRPYQQSCINDALAAFEKHRRVLLTLPTGCGKTIIFSRIAEHFSAFGRVLILAHRSELIDQARDKIARWTTLSTAVEMGAERADGFFGQQAAVVVASVQTLARKTRLARFMPDEFSLVIVDEAHHAPADTYQRILSAFPNSAILGVTATPDRLDRQGLGSTFDTAAFVYEIRDAVTDGWLAPIRQMIVRIEGLDFSSVRTTAGDLNERDLEAVMLKAQAVHGVAQATIKSAREDAGFRKTLVFGATIAHAQALATAIGAYTDPARVQALSGKDGSEERRAALVAFHRGDLDFLVNCLLFTEGFDEPSIRMVSVARPTESRALYTQMIGRGTRTFCPQKCDGICQHTDAKRDLVVLDFAGNAGKHSLVNCLDVLGGGADPSIRARAMKKIEAGACGGDVIEAIEQAQKDLAEFERRMALDAARRQRDVKIRMREVDPFATIFTVLGIRPGAGRWGGVGPTERQLEQLRRLKIDRELNLERIDRGQAAAILEAVRDRRDRGLCTFPQARVLLRFGEHPDVPFEEARRLLDLIAASGWKPLPKQTAETEPKEETAS